MFIIVQHTYAHSSESFLLGKTYGPFHTRQKALACLLNMSRKSAFSTYEDGPSPDVPVLVLNPPNGLPHKQIKFFVRPMLDPDEISMH